ncbi:MAG TPA: L,D-transpeptidase family protein [Acidimicrobiales bacterium]|nr:L,D-transpeptidase family protein [Acidimicrobiales bacterium]
MRAVRAWSLGAVAALLGMAVAGCSSAGDTEGLALGNQAQVPAEAPTPTTAEAPPDAADQEFVTTTTSPPAPLPGLGKGDSGPTVAALEKKLSELRYFVGAVDDVYDQNTVYAVTAFQKVTGMERTGRATDDVMAAVDRTTSSPPALVPAGGATRVEVDLARQVLFLYEGGNLSTILTVSSGSGARFCSEGWCRRAVTNPGSFAVYRQARGWEKGPLGSLYNPQYFDGGIAIHGATSVPPTPASHGCIRIPMAAAEWFPSRVGMGTPVYVAGPDGVPPPRVDPAAAPPGTISATPDTVAPPVTFTPGTTPPPATTPTTAPGLLDGLLGGRS